MEAPIGDDKKVSANADLERHSLDDLSIGKGDLLSQEHTDPVLNAKMKLINDVSGVYSRARDDSG